MNFDWKNELYGFEKKESCRITLILTRHCNLRCTHCNIHEWLDTKSEIFFDIKLIHVFLEQLIKIGKKRFNFVVIGGEVLTQPDRLKNVIHELREYPISITTNLVKLPKNYEFLRPVKILVSLDGLPEDHDAQRGKNSFNKTYKNLNFLIKEGFNISVQAALAPNYFNEDKWKLKKFVAMLSYLNLQQKQINIGHIVPFTTNKTQHKFEIEKLNKNTPYKKPCCSYRYMSNFVVTPDGKLYNGYYNVPKQEFCLGYITDNIEEIKLKYSNCIENAHFAKDENCLACPALKACWGLYCYSTFKYDPKLKPSDLCDQEAIIKKVRELEGN